jgi:hypothetical protein
MVRKFDGLIFIKKFNSILLYVAMIVFACVLIYNIVNWDYMAFAQPCFVLLRVLVIIVISWVLSGVIDFNIMARDHRDMYNDNYMIGS